MNDAEAMHYFLPYQWCWIRDQSPVLIGEKSRRIGWTYASSFRAVERRVAGLGNLYFTSADLTAAREFILYCKTWCEFFNVTAKEHEMEEVIDDQHIRRFILTFENGREIVAGSSNPKFFRSKGGDADADEFAFHRDGDELLKAMHATAIFWGHQLRVWSTHNGPGSVFKRMCDESRKNEAGKQSGVLAGERAGRIGGKAKVQRVTVLDAVGQGLVERIRGLDRPDLAAQREWLEELRSTCPSADTWNQEYLCEPGTEGRAYLPHDLIERAVSGETGLAPSPEELPEGRQYYAGYDVGRRHDFSVLWVLERVGDVYWTRMLRVMSNRSFSAQEAVLRGLLSRRSVRRVCIDETGLGMQLAERMKETGHERVEGVMLSAPVKHSIGAAFRDAFEQQHIRLPAYVDWDDNEGRRRVDHWLVEDLHKTRKLVTTSGNVRLAAESDSDGHADAFWAGALAMEAAEAAPRPLPKAPRERPVGW